MTIKDPAMLTKLEVWFPKYSAQYTDVNEKVALLAMYKVDYATPIILVEFTKAKHYQGQRFAISREKARSYPKETNGRILCYAVPMSAFEGWDTQTEVYQVANNLF